MNLKKYLSGAIAGAAFGLAATVAAFAAEPEDTMIITLDDGEVVIALRPDLAPKHVEQIKKLVRAGEYDNVVFHRVIDGFMAQTGDVQFGDAEDGFNLRRAGTGGSDMADIEAEFSNPDTASFQRGVVGMARAQNPNSANSQFFITFDDASFLDGQYTIFGEVESGMEFVDAIKRGDGPNGMVTADPDRMIKVEIAADR